MSNNRENKEDKVDDNILAFLDAKFSNIKQEKKKKKKVS